MKRITFLGALLFCLAFTVSAQTGLSDLEREQLKASGSGIEQSTIDINGLLARYQSLGLQSSSYQTEFTQRELLALRTYFREQNGTIENQGCGFPSDCNLMDTTPDDATSPDIWDRPFAGGTCCSGLGPVSYDVYGPFTVDTNGAYDVLSVQNGWDGYLFVYENCFDPLDQLTGFVAGNDDGAGGIGTSDIIGVALTTGVDYYVITTGFAAGDFGDFTNTITGPGAITCGGGGGGGCGAVTYSNVSPTGNGAPSQIFVDFGNAPAESADDFQLSLPPMTEATLCEISVTGSGAGIPLDPANEIILNLYNDAGGAPGALIFTETFDGPATDPGGTGSFTLTPTGTPTLQDGTLYWVSVVVSMEFGVSGQWFWSTADDGNDNEFHWQDPTNLFGLGTCPTWGPGGTVCGVAGGTGPDLLMELSFEEIPIVDNDTCATAFSVACGDVVLSETTTNTDTGGNPAPDEWYSFTGSGSPQVVTVSLCGPGTDYDSFLRVFDACGGTEIATNDDACGLQSELSFLSDGTSTYYIMVEGFSSNSGNFEMAITCVNPPVNDECTGALSIDCGETVVGETNTATFDGSAPVCATGITAPGVWYTFEDTSGLITDYTLSLCDGGTDYDSKLTVYSGDCGALVCVTDNDDSCGLQSEVNWQGDGSTTYYILVHGFGGGTGNFSMELSCLPVPPPNDMIVNSIDVDEIGFPYTDPSVAMPAATLENGNPTGCNIDGAKGVWYNFVSAGNGTATAEIVSPAGASFVVFFTAPDEMAIETDLEYFFQIGNQCAPGTSASINTAAGQAYYVFVVNDGGVTDIVIDGTLLSTDENFIQGFSFYPNPTDDTLNLSSVESIEDVAIYNLLGQQVISQDVNATSLQLDMSSLATGAYLMKVTVNGQTGTYKVIKR